MTKLIQANHIYTHFYKHLDCGLKVQLFIFFMNLRPQNCLAVAYFTTKFLRVYGVFTKNNAVFCNKLLIVT